MFPHSLTAWLIYLGVSFVAIVTFLIVILHAKKKDRERELNNQISDDVEELLNDLENGSEQC